MAFLPVATSTVAPVPRRVPNLGGDPRVATVADYQTLVAQLAPLEPPADLIPARSREDVAGSVAKGQTTAGARRRIASAGASCPFCAGRRAAVTNGLASRFPEIAAELDLDGCGGRAQAEHRVGVGDCTGAQFGQDEAETAL